MVELDRRQAITTESLAEVKPIYPHELTDIILTDSVREIMGSGSYRIVESRDRYTSQTQIVNGSSWLTYKLRDRRDDGVGWKPSKLVGWRYDGAEDAFPLGRAIERSSYYLDPRYPLTERYSPEIAQFIKNPFEELPFDEPSRDRLAKWFAQWDAVTQDALPPYPGWFYLKSIPGLYHHVHDATTALLKEKGYTHLSTVPTWFHIAKIQEHLGFEYMYAKDGVQMDALSNQLPQKTEQERRLASWRVMLQFWAQLAQDNDISPESIAGENMLRDNDNKLLLFPLSIERNLWQIKKI